MWKWDGIARRRESVSKEYPILLSVGCNIELNGKSLAIDPM
jgi:hypothetical protein